MALDHPRLLHCRGGELCLRNVSLRIRGGEKVAVVGRTGAGKSSVAMMLFRMVEKVDGGELKLNKTKLIKLY